MERAVVRTLLSFYVVTLTFSNQFAFRPTGRVYVSRYHFISPKLHYTNIVVQHVANNFTTNGQNFATSQHPDMSTVEMLGSEPNNVVQQRPIGTTVLTT